MNKRINIIIKFYIFSSENLFLVTILMLDITWLMDPCKVTKMCLSFYSRTVGKFWSTVLLVVRVLSSQRRIQKGFATGQPVWDHKFLSQINKKLKILK